MISDSVLVNETIQLLHATGGRVSATEVVDSVMRMPLTEPNFARLIVSDLVNTDPRLQLIEDTVELVQFDHDSRKLARTEFVVFDLETTGAKAPPCRITEIGAYKIKNGKIVAEFESLVNPEIPIPEFISQLTGISDDMVAGAPKFAEVIESFLEFIGDAVLVAHNAHFDMHFLNHEVGQVYDGYKVASPHLCTVQLSRKLLPNIENHRLHTVAEHFLITIKNRHRAAGDAHATAKIFIELLDQIKERGISDLAALRKIKA